MNCLVIRQLVTWMLVIWPVLATPSCHLRRGVTIVSGDVIWLETSKRHGQRVRSVSDVASEMSLTGQRRHPQFDVIGVGVGRLREAGDRQEALRTVAQPGGRRANQMAAPDTRRIVHRRGT